jgi:mannose-6-phosphate isomerase-like protein (cupin superfamily)
MIKRTNDFNINIRTNLKAGVGDIHITEFIDREEMINCRLLCEQVVPVGGSIGQHIHKYETEFYLIRKGFGKVIEQDGSHEVGPGDVVITGHGEMHSIENIGAEDLVMTAIIVTH